MHICQDGAERVDKSSLEAGNHLGTLDVLSRQYPLSAIAKAQTAK